MKMIIDAANVPIEWFARQFSPHITVCLQWERLLAERWPVQVQVYDGPDELKRCFPPWYLRDGEEVGCHVAGARPFRVADFPEVFGSLEPPRRAKIIEWMHRFRESKRPETVIVPMYDFGGDGCVLLDANHRAAGLTMSGIPCSVVAVTVRGPLDPNVLPDLGPHMQASPGS
jgi:hypothetical protein